MNERANIVRGSFVWTHCDQTGKRGYQTRANAREVARRMKGDKCRVYKCARCRLFHVGHLPRRIVQGYETRGVFEAA